MTYVPIVPQSGLLGWSFLSRTLEVQRESFSSSGVVNREIDSFRSEISKIETAEELVNNRAILSVALTAFGLEEDIDNKFFIQKILEDGTLSDDALANKFSDKRYAELSRAFGFGDFDVPRTKLSHFPDEIISSYVEKSFEVAVGEQDEDMRLALSFDREMLSVLDAGGGENTQWYNVLANSPLKLMFEEALFLPSEFSSSPIDQQVQVLKDATAAIFGNSNLSVFLDDENRETLRTRYLLASQIEGVQGSNGASVALMLLQNGVNFQF